MKPLQRFETGAGRIIFSFPARSFPTLTNNIYVIDDGEQYVLIDAGSGMERPNADLLAGFTAIGEHLGRPFSPADIGTILITHGHIDHFGGLPFLRQYTAAPAGVHVLDRRVLSNHEERMVFAYRRLETFLEGAGVSAEERVVLMSVYLFSKTYYRSTPVQFLLEEGRPTVGGFGVFHVPGHCPGQVCLLVDDVLLTADQVLSRITPHQAPESITLNMGLGHYLDSLDKVAALPGVRLGLGGHEDPIDDVPGRVAAIRAAHDERLGKVMDICRAPQSIAAISRALFGHVDSYHVLLALEETGAHVEYLHQRGELIAANLEEIEATSRPVVQYVRG
ncbi:MAG: MBL fold metallo-hydrolase [Candidatus Promineofilum sp.]|nr:MBL fold metallo-hydrolase [Promineifilum sp.]MCW5863591.1 MBL fold metallo-hydrolase [Anaerolineae bacterium]